MSAVNVTEDQDGSALEFSFESDVDSVIGDIVRLGTLGQFKEARSLVEEYLKQVDHVFPVAIEIMRLSYDQGDGEHMRLYTKELLERSESFPERNGWTAEAMRILRLMHDLFAEPEDHVLTPADRPALSAGISYDDDFDDQQILMMILMLRMHTESSETSRAPVNPLSLPAILQQPDGLCKFLEYLISRNQFWAAANTMAVCFRQAGVDCVAIWTILARPLLDSSARDDEPAMCFMMILLQVFMEGLLTCDFEKVKRLQLDQLGQHSLPSWPKLFEELQKLGTSIEESIGTDVWVNSRMYIRSKLLQIDNNVLDDITQDGFQYNQSYHTRLFALQTIAERNQDRSVTEGIRWRLQMLVAGSDSNATSLGKGVLTPPHTIYQRCRKPQEIIAQIPAEALANERDLPDLISNKFKFRNRRFFTIGKVFSVLWSGPAGETRSSPAAQWQPGVVDDPYGEKIHSEIRTFVVIREGRTYCNALPISTYRGLGVAKLGVRKSEHVPIYTGRSPPTLSPRELPAPGEIGMRTHPIKVKPHSLDEPLDPMSRLNLAGVETIFHKLKVKSRGKVKRNFLHALEAQYAQVHNFGAIIEAMNSELQDSSEQSGLEDTDGQYDVQYGPSGHRWRDNYGNERW